MKRSEFKEISTIFVETCHQIIEEDGCSGVEDCKLCPFNDANNPNIGSSIPNTCCGYFSEDNIVTTAEEFIELAASSHHKDMDESIGDYKNNPIVTDMDEIQDMDDEAYILFLSERIMELEQLNKKLCRIIDKYEKD